MQLPSVQLQGLTAAPLHSCNELSEVAEEHRHVSVCKIIIIYVLHTKFSLRTDDKQYLI